MKSIGVFFMFIAGFANPLFAQQGYSIRPLQTIWGGPGERRDISLTGEGAITDAGTVFRTETGTPANPLSNNGEYRFDYKLVEHVVTPLYTGPVTYYANSRDGSIALTAMDNPRLKAHLREHLDKGEFHFAVRKADGNLLICGLWKENGRAEKRGMDLGRNHDMRMLLGETLFDQLTWLGNAEPLATEGLADALTPGQIALLESTEVDGMRGKVTRDGGRPQVIDFYTVSFPVMEAITTPFLGAGAGMMKNYKKNINQLVVYAVHRNVPWKGSTTNLHFYLDGLYKVDAGFRPGEYQVLTAFNKQGWADSQQLQQELMQITERIRQLQHLITQCPKGSQGQDCRETYQREIKEQEARAKQKAEAFMRRHNIPQ